MQVSAQDLSTMLRCEQKTIIFLINNGGYTIEVEIHDGPYNVIKNWNYSGLVEAIDNGEGKCWTAKVSSIYPFNITTLVHESSILLINLHKILIWGALKSDKKIKFMFIFGDRLHVRRS